MSRSYLFIPGNTPSMIQTMDVFESDSVIFDLEDSVMHHEKEEACDLIVSFLTSFPKKSMKIYIRINVVNNHLVKEEIEKTKNLEITGYVIPNATTTVLQEANSLCNNLEFIAIIEDPISVLHAEEIATINNVTGLLLGAEDLTKSMGISRSKTGIEIEYARQHIAMVAHAYGLTAIDTPYTNVFDESGVKEDALYAKQIGFTAKASIHPNHIPMINQVFSPSKKEMKQALRIVTKANETNKGAFSLDGMMIDAPIIQKAKLTLKKAKKYNIG